jgi:DNA processing protein
MTVEPAAPALPPGAGGSRGSTPWTRSTAWAGRAGWDEERVARAALSRLVEPADPDLVRLLRRHPAAEVLDALWRGALDAPRAPHWSARFHRLDVDADLRAADAVKARLVHPGDPEWPAGLQDLGDAEPVALWVRGTGDLAASVERAVAIVGARACTAYGGSVAAELGASLAERGWSIVSGGAHGVDACAHRGALAAGGTTIGILASGVDQPYPPGNARLLERIATEGLLVSELPPGEHPTRGRFLVRNRLIAALPAGTVVVEASARSGALSTAHRSLQLGRPTMGVPGPVTSAMSQGIHHAIREFGMVLVTGPDQVVDAVGAVGADLAPWPQGPTVPSDRLPSDAKRVLEAVPMPGRGPQDTESIAVAAGLAADAVMSALGRLAAEGFVERTDTGWRRTAAMP